MVDEIQNQNPKTEPKTQPETGRESSEDLSLDQGLSVENLDQILKEDDPEFAASLDELSKETNLTVAEIIITKDVNWKTRTVDFLTVQYVHIKNFLYSLATHWLPLVGKKILGGLKYLLQKIKYALGLFAGLDGKKKVLFVVLLLAFVGALGLIAQSLRKGFLPKPESLYLYSLASVADQATEVTETESFYDNVKVSFYLLQLPKVIVNLKKSENSGPNPMGAFEFVVQGLSSDSLVEMKEREIEFKDFIQRVLEQLTYDEAVSVDGKKQICETLRARINEKLKTGQLKKVLIKNIILKP